MSFYIGITDMDVFYCIHLDAHIRYAIVTPLSK